MLKYYRNLDGLRAIAAVAVYVQHFFDWNNSGSALVASIRPYSSLGQHGVSLFFVLSGFVITRILIKEKEQPSYFSHFYIKRALRILPLYYLFLIVYNFFILPVFYNSHPSWLAQLPYYIYYQNFTAVFQFEAIGPPHYWSLAVEEHFYLIWPLIIYFVPSSYLTWCFIAIFGLTFGVRLHMLNLTLDISQFTFARMDQILFGAVIAYVESRTKDLQSRASIAKLILVCSTVVFIAFTLLVKKNSYWFDAFKYPFLGLLFFSLIFLLVCIKEGSFINNILINKPIQYLGQISYGIYIWHIFAIVIVQNYLQTNYILIDFTGGLIIAIVMASISYFYFEKYFLKLKPKKA